MMQIIRSFWLSSSCCFFGAERRSLEQFSRQLRLGNARRDAGCEARPAVAASVREALRPFVTEHGVRMDGAAWVVTGRRA